MKDTAVVSVSRQRPVLCFVVPFKASINDFHLFHILLDLKHPVDLHFLSALVQECNECRCCTDAIVLGGVPGKEFCSHPAGWSLGTLAKFKYL